MTSRISPEGKTVPLEELGSGSNIDANTEHAGNATEPESEEEVEKTLLRLAALIAIIWTEERQQPRDKEEGDMLAKCIRPEHTVLTALDDRQVKKILFSFAIIFCFSFAAEHITASMLQEGPSRTDEKGVKFVVFLAKNGGIGLKDGMGGGEEEVSKGKGKGKERENANYTCEEETLREELLAWFEGTGELSIADVVRRCSAKVMKDAKNSRKSLEAGRKAFKQSNLHDESGDEIASEIKRLCDAINAGQADKLVELAWDWVARYEALVSSIDNNDINEASEMTDGNSRTEAIKKCLDAIEDLIMLPRAVESLELFKNTIQTLNANLDIQFVDTDAVPEVPVKQIEDEIAKIGREMGVSVARVSVAKFLKAFNAHGEIKLLTHLHRMSAAEREQMWRFIACSKLPCFCCFYLIHDAEGYATERSHYKVYYPWPLPPELIREPGYLEGIKGLVARLEKRVRDAAAGEDQQQPGRRRGFETYENIAEAPRGMLSPRK